MPSADADVILNFAVESNALTSDTQKPIIKKVAKGSWKKNRLIQNKEKWANHRSAESQASKPAPASITQTIVVDNARPSKAVPAAEIPTAKTIHQNPPPTAAKSVQSQTHSNVKSSEKPAHSTIKPSEDSMPAAPHYATSVPIMNSQATKDTSVVKPTYTSSSIFTANPMIPLIASHPTVPKPMEDNVFSSVNTFQEMNLNPLLVKHLALKLSIKKPTKIQRAALPLLLENSHRDVLIRAQTGSGKTLTFLLPLIHRIIKASEEMDNEQACNVLTRKIGTLAVVLAPTRELARQIYNNLESVLHYSNAGIRSSARDKNSDDESSDELNSEEAPASKIFKSHWIVPGLVVGGEKKKSEKARLRKGINILISTPGRLLDHLKTTQCFEAGNLRWLVLDEADRLLELGFENSLTEIISILDWKRKSAASTIGSSIERRINVSCWPKERFRHQSNYRQTILCSATLSAEVKKLADTSLIEPFMINQDDLDKKKPISVKSLVKIEKSVREKSVVKLPVDSSLTSAKVKNGDVVKVHAEQPDTTVPQPKAKPAMEVDKKLDAPPIVKRSNDEMDISDSEMNTLTKKSKKVEEIKRLDIPQQIQQNYIIAPAKQRLMILVSMLRHIATQWKSKGDESAPCKVMVFISSCDAVDYYHRLLNEGAMRSSEDSDTNPNAFASATNLGIIDEEESGSDSEFIENPAAHKTASMNDTKPATTRPIIPFINVHKLHGNLAQSVRSKTTQIFSSSKTSILICTDVASRGLDVPDITHIVQYDPPTDLNDYAHRCGRTARMGKLGDATLFLLPSEVELLGVLEEHGVSGLTQIKAETVLGWILSDKEDGTNNTAGLNGVIDFYKEVIVKGKRIQKRKHLEVVATDVHMMLERYVLANEDMNTLARSAFTSHIRSYATHAPTHSNFCHLKRLHLGHIAKSFALREAPAGVGTNQSAVKAVQRKKKIEREKKANTGFTSFKRKSDAILANASNEFSDGNVKKLNKVRPGPVSSRK